jgi:hypothetical protein
MESKSGVRVVHVSANNQLPVFANDHEMKKRG